MACTGLVLHIGNINKISVRCAAPRNPFLVRFCYNQGGALHLRIQTCKTNFRTRHPLPLVHSRRRPLSPALRRPPLPSTPALRAPGPASLRLPLSSSLRLPHLPISPSLHHPLSLLTDVSKFALQSNHNMKSVF